MKDSDFDIINDVLAGDTSAFRVLVHNHQDDLFRLCLHILKNRQDAEDTLQEGFIKAYKSLSKFKKGSSFSTWMYRIVYNLCIDKTRKKSYQIMSLNEVEANVSEETDDDHAQEQKYLQKVLSTLPPQEQRLINLHYAHGKDMKEIGIILDCSHANVRQRMSRVRDKIKKQLTQELKKETINSQ